MTDERLMIEEEFEDENKQKNTNKKKFVFNEKNYFNDKLKKGETKRQASIRILPINGSEKYFADFSNFKAFFVTNIHSLKLRKEISGGGFKKFFCLNDQNLSDHDCTCPLCERSKELYAKANQCNPDKLWNEMTEDERKKVYNNDFDAFCKQKEAEKKSLLKSAGEYKPRKSYIVRVIERGHEEDGVKFWRFNAHTDGKGIFDLLKELYNIRNNESIKATGEKYNIFDLKNGKDIIVTSTYDPNTERTSISIADAGFQTPLSKDENQMMEWINDPKTWKDVYSIKSEDYLSVIADGGIPVWDNDKHCFVRKEEEDVENKEDATENQTEEETQIDVASEFKKLEEGPTSSDDLPF